MKKSILLLYMLVGILSSGQAWCFEAFLVQDIQILGLQRISKGAVYESLDIKTGQHVSPVQSAKIIRKLFKTGFFKDVKLQRKGNVLVVQVTERPSIGSLNISGMRNEKKVRKILQDYGIVEGRIFDKSKLDQAHRSLEWFYLSRGKYGVKINAKVVDKPRNRVAVNLEIFEGDVAKIRQIKFVGNKAFSAKILMKQLRLAESHFFSWFKGDDRYSREKLEADLENLRSFYMDNGYLNFQLDSSQVSLTQDKKHVYITLDVTEGDKYSFGPVQLKGKFVVAKAELAEVVAFSIKPGDTFSRKLVIDVQNNLQDKMGTVGFSLSSVQPIPVVDEANKIVNITYDIDPKNRVYVRRISVVGNATTQDEVYRREFTQMEGTWMSTAKVREGKNNIYRQGYAQDIDVITQMVPGSDDQVDITYKVQEQRMGEFSAGVGYSPTDRLSFKLGVSQQNFFGTGKTVDFAFDNSKSRTSYSVGYFNPFYTIDRVGFGVNAYHTKTNLSKTSRVSAYSSDTSGANFNWSVPIGKYDALSFGGGFDHTKLKFGTLVATEIRSFAKKHGESINEFFLIAGWRHNTLNRRVLPTKGLSHGINLRATVPGQKVQYYRATYDASWFQPITERFILNLSGTAGYGNGFGSTKDLPFYKHFFTGGHVRGFEENSLGPRDTRGDTFGGKMITAASAELIFPTPFKPDSQTVRTSLFFDAGQVFAKRFKANDLRYSAGVSLTWNSPLGAPLVFSLGKPLNKKPGDELRTFTFSFGTYF